MSWRLSTRLAALAVSGARVRRRCYERGWLSRDQVGAPVISVGALGWGGSGKTPVARWVSAHLRQRYGVSVGLVTRGYRGRWGARVARVGPGDHGLEVGDEAALHASSLPDAIIVRGADKARAARLAIAAGADVIVLDDGFQHLALARDLDIVLVDVSRPDGPPLSPVWVREGSDALERAQLVWLHGRDGAAPAISPEHACRPTVLSRNHPTALRAATGGARAPARSLCGRQVFAIAAVARPAAFLRLLERLGACVVGSLLLRDHEPIDDRVLARCRARAAGATLVCTEKDLYHLDVASPPDLWALECEVELLAGMDHLSAALRATLGGRGR